MAKCFLTGIEVQLEQAYLLDRGAAQRAVRSLRQRLTALERLVSQLGPIDQEQVFDPKTRTTKARSQRRLVSETVATALSASYRESPIFVTWREYTTRRPGKTAAPKDVGKEHAAAIRSAVRHAREQPEANQPQELLVAANGDSK